MQFTYNEYITRFYSTQLTDSKHMENVDSLKFKTKPALFPGRNFGEQINALSQNENYSYYLWDVELLYILLLDFGSKMLEVGRRKSEDRA